MKRFFQRTTETRSLYPSLDQKLLKHWEFRIMGINGDGVIILIWMEFEGAIWNVNACFFSSDINLWAKLLFFFYNVISNIQETITSLEIKFFASHNWICLSWTYFYWFWRVLQFTVNIEQRQYCTWFWKLLLSNNTCNILHASEIICKKSSTFE